MRTTAFAVASAAFTMAIASGRPAAQTPDSLSGVSSAEIIYAVGADLSFLKAAEDRGVQFKDNGIVRPGLDIFRDRPR